MGCTAPIGLSIDGRISVDAFSACLALNDGFTAVRLGSLGGSWRNAPSIEVSKSGSRMDERL